MNYSSFNSADQLVDMNRQTDKLIAFPQKWLKNNGVILFFLIREVPFSNFDTKKGGVRRGKLRIIIQRQSTLLKIG